MRIMIIGGAGFIGCNAARRFQQSGHDVVIVDNLSRRGSQANLDWLKSQGGVHFAPADVRQMAQVRAAFDRYPACDAVLHLAAQVAVTTSVQNPREDFEINALGSFNVLEALRETGSRALLLYASTNKVYGGMEDIAVEPQAGAVADEREGRYGYRDLPRGIAEDRLLDFHSPYGCSKGTADQYVRDYARIYGLRTVVFRQSCIYGPRQFGIEDQGWVAWFVISAVLGRPIHIYGDGKQVRDLLHVDDLVNAYDICIARSEEVAGKIFNVGGGAGYSRSVLGLIHQIERMIGAKLDYRHFDWRPGDQPVYISDFQKAERELQWKPTIDPECGVKQLFDWVRQNRELVREQLGALLN